MKAYYSINIKIHVQIKLLYVQILEGATHLEGDTMMRRRWRRKVRRKRWRRKIRRSRWRRKLRRRTRRWRRKVSRRR